MKQILIAIDQLFNTLCGGWADETLSCRAWRQQHKRHWRILRVVIDFIFFWEPNHCEASYQSEVERSHLPPAFRRKNQ